MKDIENWWTAPAEADNGSLIMVTGRSDVKKFRDNPRFSIRVEVTWPYGSGMPDDEQSEIMGIATDRFAEILAKDPVAVMTGIFTGDGSRTWVFYTISTNIFNKKLNEAFEPLPTLPLQIIAENDPSWAAYAEMSELEIHT